jgi:hypothetical protein
MYQGEPYLPISHCSHFDNARMTWALREFNFFVGVVESERVRIAG